MVFTSREKAFCVLKYARTNSNKTVQCAFVRKFSKKSPTAKQIWSWKKKFEDEGCLCRAKGFGRPATTEGKVEQICQTFLRSPKKSIKKNKYGDPDTSNDSLAGSKETFCNETLQTAARLGQSKSKNNSVLICKTILKTSSMNVLCSVMRPHFIQMAKSIGIMFVFEAKKIPMPLLSMRGTHQK